MQMQIIENWAHIEGRVESVEPNKEHAGFVTAQVAVKAANPVPGFPNLFADAPGQTIPLNLPTEVSERLKVRPGVTLSAWVRKSRPGQAFTHPDRVEVR